jgi:hypothetical protein
LRTIKIIIPSKSRNEKAASRIPTAPLLLLVSVIPIVLGGLLFVVVELPEEAVSGIRVLGVPASFVAGSRVVPDESALPDELILPALPPLLTPRLEPLLELLLPELDDVRPPELPPVACVGGGGGDLAAALLTVIGSLTCVLAPADVVAMAVSVWAPLPTDFVFHATEQLVTLVHVLSSVLPTLTFILLILPDVTLAFAVIVRLDPLTLAPLAGDVKLTVGAGTLQVERATPDPDTFELPSTPRHKP